MHAYTHSELACYVLSGAPVTIHRVSFMGGGGGGEGGHLPPPPPPKKTFSLLEYLQLIKFSSQINPLPLLMPPLEKFSK